MHNLQTLPDFSLINHEGKLVNIHEIKGQDKLIIFFYPKNESRICTAESCCFRDAYETFLSHGIKVVGINKALPEDLSKFRKNHRLPFPLLSDPDFQIHKRFGIMKFWLLSGRETFLYGTDNHLEYHFNHLLNGEKHVENLLKKIAETKPE